MTGSYVELHAKSFYSFGLGASHVHELLAQAAEHGAPALALTDTNLCGALEFARLAGSLGVRPITGGELTLTDGARIVLLAKTRAGYANLSRLFTLANGVDRREPRLDPAHLRDHAEGLVLLTGGRDGPVARLALAAGSTRPARCCATTHRGSGSTACTWSCTRTSCTGTRCATGCWRDSRGRPVCPSWPPTTSTTMRRIGRGSSTRWWRRASTPRSTGRCPTFVRTTTST